MKKMLKVFPCFFAGVLLFCMSLCFNHLYAETITADTDVFTVKLQDLAMQTACLGMYSNAEAGKSGVKDPYDYYAPSMMAERFKNMSGERTRIQTFYGVCFDYAQAAWDDIKRCKVDYENAGVNGNQWYIAETHESADKIFLYDPISDDRVYWSGSSYKDKKDGNNVEKRNGVFQKKIFEVNIKAHKDSTDIRPCWHAWLWVQKKDGIWYWVDPCWTDFFGYPVYGIVSEGEEKYLPPENQFCAVQKTASVITKKNISDEPKTSSIQSSMSKGSDYSVQNALNQIKQAVSNFYPRTIKIKGALTQKDIVALGNALRKKEEEAKSQWKNGDLSSFCYFELDLSETSGLVEICNKAFFECRLLSGIKLPSGITRIDDYAFAYTSLYLGNVIIPEGVEIIGQQAFYKNGDGAYESLHLPASIQEIGYWAFGGEKYSCICYGGTKKQWKQVKIDYSCGGNRWAKHNPFYFEIYN